MLTFDNKKMREVAAAAPYEFIEIVVNDRKYGGGGIHNLYATVAADSAWAPYLFVHEFGHHFAGPGRRVLHLPDELRAQRGAAGAVGAERDRGRRRRASGATSSRAGVALPAPWPKAEFEAAQKGFQARRRAIRAEKRPEEEMDALFREEQAWTTRLLGPAFTREGGRVRGRDVRGHRATTGRRPTASCSRATRWASAPCAGAPSSA